LAALAGLAGPLRADEPVYGGQVSLCLPQDDLNGGKRYHGNAGLGAGVHLLWTYAGGHALRLRGDGSLLPRGPIQVQDRDRDTLLYTESAKVRLLQAGADYNFFPAGVPEGLYFLAGLGYTWAGFYGAGLVPGGQGDLATPWPSHHSASALTYALGLGTRVTEHLGGELRFAQADLGNVGVAGTSVRALTVNASLTLDF
jgi:hypothetical protein